LAKEKLHLVLQKDPTPNPNDGQWHWNQVMIIKKWFRSSKDVQSRFDCFRIVALFLLNSSERLYRVCCAVFAKHFGLARSILEPNGA
jgi:hypothetical protein